MLNYFQNVAPYHCSVHAIGDVTFLKLLFWSFYNPACYGRQNFLFWVYFANILRWAKYCEDVAFSESDLASGLKFKKYYIIQN